MKYIITESKLFNTIYQYIDNYLDANKIDWIYGVGFDDEGYADIDIESKDNLRFYKGNWEGEDYTDLVFDYFTVNFYKDDPGSWKDKAPILEVRGVYGEHLDSLFNDLWKKPMSKWFQDKFNLPVKTVSMYY